VAVPSVKQDFAGLRHRLTLKGVLDVNPDAAVRITRSYNAASMPASVRTSSGPLVK
jgi:hypothetical protein